MVDAVWEKEAFFVPGVPVLLYPVLPQQSEQLGESRDQNECVPQCGQFLFWLLQSRFFDEMYCFGAYQRLVSLGIRLTDESSRPILCSAL